MNWLVSKMTSAPIWRKGMTEYEIIPDSSSVSICKDCDESVMAFIDIYTDDEDTPSPFKDIETAKAFAEIIVKLLKVVDNSDIE